MSHTTIRISERNYLRLKQQGFTGDSFDFVLGRILDQIAVERKIVDAQGFPAKSTPESLAVNPKELNSSER